MIGGFIIGFFIALIAIVFICAIDEENRANRN